MRKELDEQLCKEFPQLFADRNAPAQTTCMCWGFSCGDGWFNIIHELCRDLSKMIEELPDYYTCECGHEICDHVNLDVRRGCEGDFEGVPCGCDKYVPRGSLFKATQVKEKFGGLRFYMTYETEEMGKRIDEAMRASYHTCEECGKPGENCRINLWYSTLCRPCYDKEIAVVKSRKYFEEENCFYGDPEQDGS